MFKTYLKITLRNFKRHKLFSFINVFGLAIGLSICMIISIWVIRELSYDTFHSNSGRIYRIERELFRDNSYSRWPITSGAYRQALVDDFPEIEQAVRFWRREFPIRDNQNIVHKQSLFAVDNSLFDVFDFSLESGDEQTALVKPMSLVLTRERAITYFGTADVIGKTLMCEMNGEQTDFTVTGILKEVPQNSHIRFDMLMSITSYPGERFNDWRSNYLFTYILTSNNTSKIDLEEKLKSFVEQRLEPVYGDLLTRDHSIHEVLKIHLMPLTDIHLNPSPNWEIGDGGSLVSVYIFISIAVLILLIACLNFMNLSSAGANRRAKEVGLRKAIGADKKQLRIQFLLESVFMTLVAFIIALNLSSLLMPLFNSFFNENLSIHTILNFKSMIISIGIVLVVGFLAGLYPAFLLTKFEPVRVLKGSIFSNGKKSLFRRNMVIIQFAISAIIIISTLTIQQQMRFIQNRSLGFNKENIVIIPGCGPQIINGIDNFRNELMANPQIISVASSSDLPGESFYSNTNFYNQENPNEPVMTIILATDYQFLETYRMKMIAGRSFSKTSPSDKTGTIILNEAAVRKFAWTPEEAVGKELVFFHGGKGNIAGVVKDFNFRSLHNEVEPLAMLLYPGYCRTISIRIKPGNIQRTIASIREKWDNTYPGETFEFSFMDQRMDHLYKNEHKMQKLLLIFSGFSIFVACLGLFGLSVFIVAERTKEIGIRKVLGAPNTTLVLMLSKDFTKWVLTANLFAWPMAWSIMNKWLQNFAYRIDFTILPFIITCLTVLLVALVTVCWQAVRATMANPINSIRYE